MNWQPIETAPEGQLVVVAWYDRVSGEPMKQYDFDYREDGVWSQYADYVEYANAVAPPGSTMPQETPPYQWWTELPRMPPPPSVEDGERE